MFFYSFSGYEVLTWALALGARVLPAAKTLLMDLFNQDLSYRFNISYSSVSKLLNKYRAASNSSKAVL